MTSHRLPKDERRSILSRRAAASAIKEARRRQGNDLSALLRAAGRQRRERSAGAGEDQ